MHDQMQRKRTPSRTPSRIQKLLKYIRSEPVAVQSVIQASLAALVGFGVITLTNEQTGLLLTLLATVLAAVTRQQVKPYSKAEKKAAPSE